MNIDPKISKAASDLSKRRKSKTYPFNNPEIAKRAAGLAAKKRTEDAKKRHETQEEKA